MSDDHITLNRDLTLSVYSVATTFAGRWAWPLIRGTRPLASRRWTT